MAILNPLSEEQLHAIVIIERVNSGLSIAGCIFIALTFLLSKAFHKPINRLVFYASVGNIMTNIATLVSRSALAKDNVALCQVQGFLIQMFMCADALWSLAMACNVYLTFFWKYDEERLRTMEKWYFLFCYGIPFIPAFLYLFIMPNHKTHMYGNATLWCWIDSDYDIVRIATFYGPVWLVIFVTFAIYIRAGKEIYKRRRQLRSFQTHSHPTNDHIESVSGNGPASPRGSGSVSVGIGGVQDLHNLFASMKTTEVHVTSESAVLDTDHPAHTHASHPIDLSRLGRRAPAAPERPLYSVTVSSHAPRCESSLSLPSSTGSGNGNGNGNSVINGSGGGPRQKAERMMGVNQTTVSASLPPLPASERSYPRTTTTTQYRVAAMEANSAAWGYTKVAVLFFTAMLVTWIPSSANRVYSVVHLNHISTPLQFMSAFVLPLQGFWNAVIYVMTSWAACKLVFGELWNSFACGCRKNGKREAGVGDALPPAYNMHWRRDQRMGMGIGGGKGSETESMTELASRGGSQDDMGWRDSRK